MASLRSPFQPGCFVWFSWRRVWYLARVEETRDTVPGDQDVELLLHIHGESLTKDKWLTFHRDGTPTMGAPPLSLLQILPTALACVGSLPAVGNRVQLLVVDQTLVDLVASRRADVNSSTLDMPVLVGVVVKVLPARDASLVDVAYPSGLVGYPSDDIHWQRVQIGNGFTSTALAWRLMQRKGSNELSLPDQSEVVQLTPEQMNFFAARFDGINAQLQLVNQALQGLQTKNCQLDEKIDRQPMCRRPAQDQLAATGTRGLDTPVEQELFLFSEHEGGDNLFAVETLQARAHAEHESTLDTTNVI
ncbi:hypothetical protein ON010_g5914 [Phytophthora cinnamomi]|nr:hypothetical protein ON010_g5914 [Phytophthora cinnamomi]